MIDLHAHILPGLDDGVRSIEEALDLARESVADGVRVLAATPHVRSDYPTTPAQMEDALARVQRAIAGAGIELEVVAGGEIDIVRLSLLADDELRRFSYAGRGTHVLLEFPDAGWPLALDASVDAVRAAGMTPVLAHPERNREVTAHPGRLRLLVEAGALIQVTAASLEGRLGRTALATGRILIERGLVHLIASDAHGPRIRTAGLRAAAAAVAEPRLVHYLTEEAPAAILAGHGVGEPPMPRRRRRRWFGR